MTPLRRLSRASGPVFLLVLFACDGGQPDHEAVTTWISRTSSSAFETVDTISRICDDCLVLERVVALGDESGPGFYEGSAEAAIDDEGRYWITAGEVVKVYSATGPFEMMVGRDGQGPGEFQRAARIYRSSDGRMHVFDGGNARRSVFLPDGRYVEGIPLPGLVRDVAYHRPSGLPAVNMILNTPDFIGAPIHLLGDTGVVRSFASPESGSLRENMLRNVAVDPSGRIYGAKRWDYTIDVWAPDGSRIFGVSRPGLWTRFPDGESRALVKGSEPAGFIQDIKVDDQGRLWVVSSVPQDDWADHVREVDLGDIVVLEPTEGLASIYDTVIEVIDLDRSAVVARTRHELVMRGFLEDNLLYGDRLTAQAEPVLQIWRVGLKEAP